MCILVKYGTEKYAKNLVGVGGKTDIQDALQRLDILTTEETKMTTAINLEVAHNIESRVKSLEALAQKVAGNQLRDSLRKWLVPPNYLLNHDLARHRQHDGTATWFLEGTRFKEWKTNGSLLWIHGKRTRPCYVSLCH
jgi:hypothetical protein